MSINVCTLVGNVGKTPELQYLPSGSSVLQFSLALSRPAREGQPQPPTWVDCKAWNKTAQFAADHVVKGAKVGVVGRLEVEEWADRTSGEKRRRTVIVVDRLELCSSKPRGEEPAGLGDEPPF